MRNADFFDLARDRFGSGLAEFGHRWGWYFALGIFLILLGAIAATMAVATTWLSAFVLGSILLVAGAGLILLSFLTGRWSGFLLSLAAGNHSGTTGIMLIRAPLAGAAGLTLLIAAFLMVAGIYRAVSAIVMRFPNWGWSAVSGLVSLALGAILIAGWPASGLWFLGLYIGIDLIVQGFAWVMFALRIRSLGLALDEADWGSRAA